MHVVPRILQRIVRVAGQNGLLIAVVALSLAACDGGSQPAESVGAITPLPATAVSTPASAVAPTESEAPTLAEAANFTRPCAGIADADYDQVRTLVHPDGYRTVSIFNHSSSDYNETITSYGPDGITVLGRGESVLKDGVYYVRVSKLSGDEDTLSQWVVVGTNENPLFQKGCLGAVQVSDAQAVGEAEDEDLRHLVWEEEEFASQYEGERNVWEMWVDSDGNPVRGLVTVYRVPEESSASGAGGPPDGVRTPEAAYTIEETYSGFGEPNTITAPITPPTPTPPTPTSAVPTWTPVPTSTPMAES